MDFFVKKGSAVVDEISKLQSKTEFSHKIDCKTI